METYRPLFKMDIWHFGVKQLYCSGTKASQMHAGRRGSLFARYAADEGTAYCLIAFTVVPCAALPVGAVHSAPPAAPSHQRGRLCRAKHAAEGGELNSLFNK